MMRNIEIGKEVDVGGLLLSFVRIGIKKNLRSFFSHSAKWVIYP